MYRAGQVNAFYILAFPMHNIIYFNAIFILRNSNYEAEHAIK